MKWTRRRSVYKILKENEKGFLSYPLLASKFPNCQSCGHHQLSHFCLLNKDNADDDKSFEKNCPRSHNLDVFLFLGGTIGSGFIITR